MCGFLCEFEKKPGGGASVEAFDAMLEKLRSRGPDHVSTYHRNGIKLGHTRLSVIDLETGDQPVFNESKTIGCILNGEIYNYRELRAELETRGHRFRTRTDTEVIVHLYEEMGPDSFGRLKGMFAAAVVDFARHELIVARDRMGEKPVYILDTPGSVSFASEIKALMIHPAMRKEIDPLALAQYLRLGYVTAPRSIWKGCKKLRPARLVVVSDRGIEERTYWRPSFRELGRLDRRELTEMVCGELAQAIPGKLVADVPVGIFLSGGLDSSIITAFAAGGASEPLRTFSVGFGDAISELPYAREVSNRYGTIHTELQVTPDLEDIDIALEYVDEPFADSSIIPTLAVAREARKHVKVVLTGDGGDELFGGYEAYLDQAYFCASRTLGGAIRRFDVGMRALTGRRLIDTIYPLPQSNGDLSGRRRFRDLRGLFNEVEINRLLGRAATTAHEEEIDHVPLRDQDPLSQAFGFDLNVYLPDDLLKKVDMASMCWGLECRAPLLDHEFVEFAMSIPAREKLRGGVTKRLLRDAMRDRLPESVLRRGKHGFGSPIRTWLAGPLAGELQQVERTLPGILVDRDAVRDIVTEGVRNLDADWRAPLRLWALYSLSKWCGFHGI
jgi:asparagine synthase (glutamine-hydrolysing)